MFTFLVLLTFSLSANAADEYGTDFPTMKDNRIFKVINENAGRLKEKMAQQPVKNKAISWIAGRSGTEIVDHYLGMASFLAENTPTNTTWNKRVQDDVGSEYAGYVMARTYFTDLDYLRLKETMPKALEEYAKSDGKMNWDEWVEKFEGDTMLATKAIVFKNGWVRKGLKHGYQPEKPEVAELSEALEDDRWGVSGKGRLYAMTPFKPDAFGLNLSGTKESWGKGYKTVAGMNLALAAKNQGYSDADTKMVVSRAALLYETVDLLADHIGVPMEGVSQVSDRRSYGAREAYKKFADALRAKLKEDPALLQRMIGSVFGFPALGQHVPADSGIDLNEDLVLVFLLMNYLHESESGYARDIEPLFSHIKDGNALKDLFRIGVGDAQALMAGGQFVIEKTQKLKPHEINPCLGEVPFKGILELGANMQSILSYL